MFRYTVRNITIMHSRLFSTADSMLHSVRPARVLRAMRHAVVPLCVIVSIAVIGVVLFARSHRVMREQLREYLRATAAAAAMQFDGMDMTDFRTAKALETKRFATIAGKLGALRNAIPSIRYAYIMERTDHPDALLFLADADALAGLAELDKNGNGLVDADEQPSFPGDLYDITNVPALQGPAFEHPTVDDDVTVDAWGQLMSGYAPIHNANGVTTAILGIDMEADAFERLSYSIFSFESLVLLFCGAFLLAVYVGLEMWRRRMEAAEQLEADRRALLDLASHQFGAPLTTFKWWLEILKEREGGKLCKESDVCVQMDEGIRRMDEIVRALRSVDVAEATDHKASCDLGAAAEQSMHEARLVLSRKKQTCTLDVPPALPQVRVDAALLRGVLEELIENASSYSPDASCIVLKAEYRGSMVHVAVTDTGDGIAPSELPHIAQKFMRGRTAFRRKPVGNGLGLWIVRSIVERAKGKFWVESTLGKGTTVHLELPIV